MANQSKNYADKDEAKGVFPGEKGEDKESVKSLENFLIRDLPESKDKYSKIRKINQDKK